MENENGMENSEQGNERRPMPRVFDPVAVVAFLAIIAVGVYFVGKAVAAGDDRHAAPVIHRGCTVQSFGSVSYGWNDYRPTLETTCGSYVVTNTEEMGLLHVGETYSLSSTPGNWAESPLLLGAAK